MATEETPMETETPTVTETPEASVEETTATKNEKETTETKKETETETEETKETTVENDAEGKKEEKGPPVKPDPKLLDLAFAMDCTGSMASYIHQAQQNIRMIVEEIVAKEAADVRMALVEYRDHPPQDSSFITRVNDFTPSSRTMKGWLDQCSAAGGGDCPEAVADALHQVLKLSWRPTATKICVFISDAPPHGLGSGGDGFPNGCPAGLDPMRTCNELAAKGVLLYLVGCEPAILPYKEFFSAIAHLTGGQYIPLRHSKLLTKVIIGGAQEEMSLQELMAEVEREVAREAANSDVIHEDQLSKRLHERMASRGVKSKKLTYNAGSIPQASDYAQELSYCPDMGEVRTKYQSAPAPSSATYEAAPSKESYKKSKKSSGGGILASMTGMFSRWSAAPETMSAPAASASAPSPMEDTYGVCENADIEEHQVSRLVQQAVMKNNVRSKSVRAPPKE